MEMLAKAGAAFQRLFGPVVEEVAERTTVIRRRREFTPMSLAMTFVLGHLWTPKASLADLAKVAVQLGANVTPQAVDQRFRLTDANVDTVIEICRQLDGMALAIRLAAGRLPLLGLQGLKQRLRERLKLLVGSQFYAPGNLELHVAGFQPARDFAKRNAGVMPEDRNSFIWSLSQPLMPSASADLQRVANSSIRLTARPMS